MGRYGSMLLCGVACALAVGAGCPLPKPAVKVLFSSDRNSGSLDNSVYSMNSDGSDPLVLANLPQAGTTISTNDTWMVFAAIPSPTAGLTAIYRVNLDGTGLVQLTSGSGDDAGPLITSDRSRVVFQSEAGNTEIRSVLMDGTGLVNLSNHAGEDFLPAVRPGSEQVAFTSRRDGNSEIYVVDQAGGTATNLTQGPNGDDSQPVYSPDGTRIAFLSNRDGNQDVYVMNPDGTGQTNVSNHAADDLNAKFSPDGTMLAYVSGSAVGHFEIWVADLVAGGSVRLTDQLDMAHEWSWSPDSQQVGFVSTQGGSADVYVIRTDGTGLTNLTHDPAAAYGPLWSPDSLRLFFESFRDGNWEIYSMAPDGTAQTNLTSNPADDRLRDVVGLP
jgi:Tol biopolymer transport system component